MAYKIKCEKCGENNYICEHSDSFVCTKCGIVCNLTLETVYEIIPDEDLGVIDIDQPIKKLDPGEPISHDQVMNMARIIMEENLNTMRSKNKKYATSDDGLSNFRFYPICGIITRINDKINRLKAMYEKGMTDNPSFEDAFLDLANYAIIGSLLHRLGVDQAFMGTREKYNKIADQVDSMADL
jgi:hypothetical protein